MSEEAKIHYPSAQAVFDRAYERVMAQGRGSTLPEPDSVICLYSDGKGGACAIGHLTDDEEQRKEWDERALSASSMTHIFEIGGVDPTELGEFLRDLQQAHDTAARMLSEPFVDAFASAMQRMARKYRLTAPPDHRTRGGFTGGV